MQALAAAALALHATAAFGQAAPAPSTVSTVIRVSTDLVQVPVLAFRPPFRPAPGLGSGSFTIRLDGGPPFHPSYARVEASEPIGLSIIADADPNANPGGAEPLSRALEAALQGWPADLLDNTDSVSLYAAGCRLMRSLDRVPAGFARRSGLLARAASPSVFQAALEKAPSCPRPPLDHVLQAVMQANPTSHAWKAVLLLVDGEQNFSPAALEELRAIAASRGVALFAIRYSRDGSFPGSAVPDQAGLDALVSSLGGVSLPSSYADLGGVMETMVRALRQRYILSFPRPEGGTAGSHLLEVRTKVSGVRVRAAAASAPLVNESDAGLHTGQRPRYRVYGAQPQ